MSYEMARKYLEGKSIPRPDVQAKIAEWLGISQSWLQFGEGQETTVEKTIDPKTLQQCFEAISKVTSAKGVTLKFTEELRLACHLYDNPNHRNDNDIASLLPLFM